MTSYVMNLYSDVEGKDYCIYSKIIYIIDFLCYRTCHLYFSIFFIILTD